MLYLQNLEEWTRGDISLLLLHPPNHALSPNGGYFLPYKGVLDTSFIIWRSSSLLFNTQVSEEQPRTELRWGTSFSPYIQAGIGQLQVFPSFPVLRMLEFVAVGPTVAESWEQNPALCHGSPPAEPRSQLPSWEEGLETLSPGAPFGHSFIGKAKLQTQLLHELLELKAGLWSRGPAARRIPPPGQP